MLGIYIFKVRYAIYYKHEVKLGKVQRSLSLLSVQRLGCTEVLKVLVVRPNLKLAWGTFKVVVLEPRQRL